MDARPLLQLSTVLLAIGAGAYYGLGDWRQPAGLADSAQGPDYLAEGLILVETDTKGLVSRQMRGRTLVHEPDPEHFRLSAPVLTLFKAGQPVWEITARHADSPDPGHDIWLREAVRVRRVAAGSEPLQLDTDRLHADPARNRLDTPAAVTLSTTRGRLQAVGLEADLNRHTLDLLSAVEVNYAASR